MIVELERIFNVTEEKLYGSWTNPETISRWFGVPVEIEPHIGGFIKIDFKEKDITRGTFKELNPYSKISFSWNSFVKDEPTGETLVTVTFERVASGKTKMKLVHSGFTSEHVRKAHEGGWNSYFNEWEKQVAA